MLNMYHMAQTALQQCSHCNMFSRNNQYNMRYNILRKNLHAKTRSLIPGKIAANIHKSDDCVSIDVLTWGLSDYNIVYMSFLEHISQFLLR